MSILDTLSMALFYVVFIEFESLMVSPFVYGRGGILDFKVSMVFSVCVLTVSYC